MCEKEIEVDGEPAILTVLDTWDAEVRLDLCGSEDGTHTHIILYNLYLTVFVFAD